MAVREGVVGDHRIAAGADIDQYRAVAARTDLFREPGMLLPFRIEGAENSDGGHNYGYRVDMERLKRKELPPKEWFEKAIKRCKDNLGYLKSSIERTEETIKTYENLLS